MNNICLNVNHAIIFYQIDNIYLS